MSAAELTLYAVEQDLQAYLDTEEIVPVEQLAEFQAALAAKGDAALSKRDACIRAFRAIDAQIEFCKNERERLGERQKTLENGLKRFRKYLASVIEATGQKKLEGRIGTISYRKGATSVEVTDVSAVPLDCKTLTIEVGADVLSELLRTLHGPAGDLISPGLIQNLEAAAKDAKVNPDKKALKERLETERTSILQRFEDDLAFSTDAYEKAQIEAAREEAIATAERLLGARLATGDPTVAVK